MTFVVGALMHRHDNAKLALVRRSFRPVSAGLWIATGIIIALATDHSPAAVASRSR